MILVPSIIFLGFNVAFAPRLLVQKTAAVLAVDVLALWYFERLRWRSFSRGLLLQKVGAVLAVLSLVRVAAH